MLLLWSRGGGLRKQLVKRLGLVAIGIAHQIVNLWKIAASGAAM
jgi:hypothetical protein